jgi:hypothetical protein
MTTDALIDRKQIASMLGVSVRTIRRLEPKIGLDKVRVRVPAHPYLWRASVVRVRLKRIGIVI